jgi:hypothetical protein
MSTVSPDLRFQVSELFLTNTVFDFCLQQVDSVNFDALIHFIKQFPTNILLSHHNFTHSRFNIAHFSIALVDSAVAFVDQFGEVEA